MFCVLDYSNLDSCFFVLLLRVLSVCLCLYGCSPKERKNERDETRDNSAKSVKPWTVVLWHGCRDAKRDVQQVVNEDERITATGLFNVRLLEIVQSQKCDLVTQKLQTVTTFSLGDLVTKNVEKALKIKACASLCSTCNFQAAQH